jgi:hypothetical protein
MSEMLLTRKQTVEEYEKDQKLTARFGTASLFGQSSGGNSHVVSLSSL